MVARRVLFVAICLFLFGLYPASATPIDRNDADRIAQAQLTYLGAGDRLPTRQVEIHSDAGLLARVVVLAPAGYVVVSADTDLPPVVAYSLHATYPAAAAQDNPLSTLLAADLTARLAAKDRVDPAVIARRDALWQARRDGPTTAARLEQWPPTGTTATGGWLESNWTQNSPYNNFCPIDRAGGGARSVAGCPAVAMGMILNFLATTNGTQFDTGDRYYHNYGGNRYWIPDAATTYDFPDFATLNGHLTTLNAHWDAGAALTSDDKAALVFACGVAATQVYTAGGSGTFGVDQAHDAYLRFGFTNCRLLVDEPDLFPSLAAEMQKGHPAHLAVVNTGWTAGHNVVVDGYNSDDYYHLNFGWGGVYNGWYLLPSEIPYDLTVIEGVILDIAPDASAVDEDPAVPAQVTALDLAAHPNPFNPRTEIVFTAPVDGSARVVVYDLTGRQVAVLLDGPVHAGRTTLTWTPANLASGVYLVRATCGSLQNTTRLVLAK